MSCSSPGRDSGLRRRRRSLRVSLLLTLALDVNRAGLGKGNGGISVWRRSDLTVPSVPDLKGRLGLRPSTVLILSSSSYRLNDELLSDDGLVHKIDD